MTEKSVGSKYPPPTLTSEEPVTKAVASSNLDRGKQNCISCSKPHIIRVIIVGVVGMRITLRESQSLRCFFGKALHPVRLHDPVLDKLSRAREKFSRYAHDDGPPTIVCNSVCPANKCSPIPTASTRPITYSTFASYLEICAFQMLGCQGEGTNIRRKVGKRLQNTRHEPRVGFLDVVLDEARYSVLAEI